MGGPGFIRGRAEALCIGRRGAARFAGAMCWASFANPALGVTFIRSSPNSWHKCMHRIWNSNKQDRWFQQWGFISWKPGMAGSIWPSIFTFGLCLAQGKERIDWHESFFAMGIALGVQSMHVVFKYLDGFSLGHGEGLVGERR